MKAITFAAVALAALASSTCYAGNNASVAQAGFADRFMAMLADPAARPSTAPGVMQADTNCTKNSECDSQCCCKIGSSKACYDKSDCSNSGGSC